MPRIAKTRTLFAERLVHIRTTKGITQIELARLAGISPRAVAHYETVGRSPSPEVAVRLAKALKVSIDEIMGHKALSEKGPLVKNKRLLKKMKELDELPTEDQKTILRMIDRFHNDTKRKPE